MSAEASKSGHTVCDNLSGINDVVMFGIEGWTMNRQIHSWGTSPIVSDVLERIELAIEQLGASDKSLEKGVAVNFKSSVLNKILFLEEFSNLQVLSNIDTW